MKRFFAGLVLGGVTGGVVYCFTRHAELAVTAGLAMALIVWFTRIADVIVDFFAALVG